MPKIEVIKTVFHGTTSNNVDSLRNDIDLSRGSKWSDFGKGFYTTTSYIQAKKWSIKRRDSFNTFRSPKDFVDAVVFEYTVDTNKLLEFNGKHFPYASTDWAKFIYSNRSQQFEYIHNYDYVYGLVADGDTDELIKDLDAGIITMSKFKQLIDSSRFGFNDQLSFHTQESVSCLMFMKEVNYNEKQKKTIINKK